MIQINRDGTKQHVPDESDDFKPGDVVLMNSGSRKMTVENVHEDGRCDLVWFADERICRASKVAPEALRTVEEMRADRERVDREG